MKLITQADRTAAALQVKTAIDEYCRTAYGDGHRTHLGASLIGHDCSRYLWYVFRWVKAPAFSGRMQRLFNRGHREEARFIEWLEGVGFTVIKPAFDDEQWRVSDVFGHFGGSLDGMAVTDGMRADSEQFLLEFKTSGTGAAFNAMIANGVRRTKPQHFAQMCVYGTLRQLHYALYMMINKNDDDLHVEFIELDWNYGNELIGKAHAVIVAQELPAKLSQSEAFHVCAFCDFKDICHNVEPIEKNCRSCRLSSPDIDASWRCAHFDATIPKDFIPNGCDNWTAITNAAP